MGKKADEEAKKAAEERKKQRALDGNASSEGESEDDPCDNCDVGERQKKCFECSKIYCRACDDLLHNDPERKNHKRMTLQEAEEFEKKLKEEEEKKKEEEERDKARQRAEDAHKENVAKTYAQEKKDLEEKARRAASMGRGRCNVGNCDCKLYEVDENEPKMCHRCWHTEADHMSLKKCYFMPGDLVSFSSLAGWKNGTVTICYPDGTFQVQAEDHSRVPRLQPEQIKARKAKFECGDKVEYSTMKGWIDATIYEHNKNGTYQLMLLDKKTIIERQSENNIRKRERGTKWVCPICKYINKCS